MASDSTNSNAIATTTTTKDATPSYAPVCHQMRGFIAEQAIFSHDSSLLFLYSANNIYIHSVQTGECICCLKGHLARVVSLVINPCNHLQLVSMDERGTIKIWDYLRSKCVDSIAAKHSGQQYASLTACKAMSASSSSSASASHSLSRHSYVYCLLNQQHIVAINLRTKHVTPIIHDIGKHKQCSKNEAESFQNLAITANGDYLAAIMQKELILIRMAYNETDIVVSNLEIVSYRTRGWRLASSLAFHPGNECIAFGDQRGGIHLWHDFVSMFSKSPQAALSIFTPHRSNNNGNSNSNKQWHTLSEYLSSTNNDHMDTDTDDSETETETETASDATKPKSRTKNTKNTKNTRKTMTSKTKKKKGGTTEHRYLLKQIHWHSHMISSVAFTTDGAYMLSGGEESVLVMTQLETQRHQFLPRLGGAISFIAVSPDEVKFAVGVDSNKIRIVDSINNKIVKTLDGIAVCHRMRPRLDAFHQRYAANPRNHHCYVLPSTPGTVQFYDLQKDRSRGVLECVQYPIVSRTQEREMARYVAQLMQFNANGTRLITVLKRTVHSILGVDDDDDDGGGGGGGAKEDGGDDMECTENTVHLITLQIWHYDASTDEFVLNTRVDSPHGGHSLGGIVFHPQKNRFLTFARHDHNFRIWEECHVTTHLKPDTTTDTTTSSEEQRGIDKMLSAYTHKKHTSWKSLMAGYYHRDAVTAAQYSNDGTILFVAAGNMLTLWNSHNLMLLKKIAQSTRIQAMHSFHDLPYLLTVQREARDVVIWDLVQFKQHWSLKTTLAMRSVLDVLLIPSRSRCLFLVACQLQESSGGDDDKESKYLCLCDMQNKHIIHRWRLPHYLEVRPNCMIVEPHILRNKKKKKKTKTLSMEEDDAVVDKDMDVVFLTSNGPVRIPCLQTQWNLKSNASSEANPMADDAVHGESVDQDVVSKYLDQLSGNHSIFKSIFGAKQLKSNPVTRQELERQQKLTRRKLLELTPKKQSQNDVVIDMFSGPAHTLPAMTEIFDQYMAYFVPPNNNDAENAESGKKRTEPDSNKAYLGDTNILLNGTRDKSKNGVINNTVTQISISRKHDSVTADSKRGKTKHDSVNVADASDDNDDDFEMDETDMETLKSMIDKPLDLNGASKKRKSKKSKSKSKSKNTVLSSFWRIHDGLISHSHSHGPNGTNGGLLAGVKKTNGMNGLQ